MAAIARTDSGPNQEVLGLSHWWQEETLIVDSSSVALPQLLVACWLGSSASEKRRDPLVLKIINTSVSRRDVDIVGGAPQH